MKTCFLSLCSSGNPYNTSETYYRFPTEPKILRKWLAFVSQWNPQPLCFDINTQPTICSAHFVWTDFIQNKYEMIRSGVLEIGLRKNAVPSVFLCKQDCFDAAVSDPLNTMNLLQEEEELDLKLDPITDPIKMEINDNIDPLAECTDVEYAIPNMDEFKDEESDESDMLSETDDELLTSGSEEFEIKSELENELIMESDDTHPLVDNKSKIHTTEIKIPQHSVIGQKKMNAFINELVPSSKCSVSSLFKSHQGQSINEIQNGLADWNRHRQCNIDINNLKALNRKANLELYKLKVALQNEEENVRLLKNKLATATNEVQIYKRKLNSLPGLVRDVEFSNAKDFF